MELVHYTHDRPPPPATIQGHKQRRGAIQSKTVYSYEDIENAYKILKNVVERENKLHEMDMTVNTFHLDAIEYEILPALEEIVYYDPTP